MKPLGSDGGLGDGARVREARPGEGVDDRRIGASKRWLKEIYLYLDPTSQVFPGDNKVQKAPVRLLKTICWKVLVGNISFRRCRDVWNLVS